jgi:hypothetical protein
VLPATITFIRRSDELPRLGLFFARLGVQMYFVLEKVWQKSGKRLRSEILIEQRRAKLLILLVAGGGIEPPTLGL